MFELTWSQVTLALMVFEKYLSRYLGFLLREKLVSW